MSLGIYNVGTQNKHGDNAVDEDEKIKIKTHGTKNVTGKSWYRYSR